MTVPPAGLPPAGPPPAGPQPAGRHSRAAQPSRLITRIVPTGELPAGVGALASADGATVYVSTSLSKSARRAAVSEVLRATHRFPGLVMIPGLVSARVRRFFEAMGESSSVLMQHASTLATASPMATTAVSAVAVAVLAAGTAGIVVAAAPPGTPASPRPPAASAAQKEPYPVPTTAPKHPVVIRLPAYPASYLGVYAKGAPRSYAPVESFAQATGVQPNLALYYSGWGEPFNAAFAVAAADNNAVPVIQMDPDHISLAAIAAGDYDPYLEMFADAVAGYGLRTGQGVVIGFGHEMNSVGPSWRGSPGNVFVAAWQRVVTVFRDHKADNVTWMWTVNSVSSGPVNSYYPGSAYVTWVGIDAYFRQPGDTFSSVFGPSISAVQSAAPGKPILLSETATAAGPTRGYQISSLFNGIRSRQILGFIWFDATGTTGTDWSVEGTPAAAEFRQAARGYP